MSFPPSPHPPPTTAAEARPDPDAIPALHPNGSPSPVVTPATTGLEGPPPAEPPRPRRRGRNRARLVKLGLGLLALGAAGFGVYKYTRPTATVRPDLLLHKVKAEPLQMTVVERGTLESADNRDVVVRVKAGQG